MWIYLTIVSNICLIASLLLNIFQAKVINRFPRERERQENVHRARETELLDRIMYQARQTWNPPPRPEEQDAETQDEEIKRELEGWVSV